MKTNTLPLKKSPPHDEGIAFAYLADIRPDPHYGFTVEYDGVAGPRSLYVAALLASSTKSKKEAMGDTGYKITTANVKDIANPAGTPDDPCGSHSVTGFCTLDGLTAFELSPPRSKKVALAFFTRADPQDGLLLHALQHVENDSTEAAVACMQRLCRLAIGVRPTSTEKRSRAVSTLAQLTDSPTVKAARTLQSVPTGGSLPDTRPK